MGLPKTFHKSTPPRGRTQCHAGQMNGQETAYSLYLNAMKATAIIIDWWWDVLSIRMADSTFYKPDFLVMRADGTLEIHEVKGFMEDDAWVKLKVVAETYPFPIWVIKRKPKTKNEWTWKQVGLPEPGAPKKPVPPPPAKITWPK